MRAPGFGLVVCRLRAFALFAPENAISLKWGNGIFTFKSILDLILGAQGSLFEACSSIL